MSSYWVRAAGILSQRASASQQSQLKWLKTLTLHLDCLYYCYKLYWLRVSRHGGNPSLSLVEPREFIRLLCQSVAAHFCITPSLACKMTLCCTTPRFLYEGLQNLDRNVCKPPADIPQLYIFKTSTKPFNTHQPITRSLEQYYPIKTEQKY